MSAIETYSTTAGDNDSPPPDGFPEGQTPASLNDGIRELMAALAVLLRQLPWVKLSTGQTVVRDSATQFSLTGVDLTSIYSVGRRIREVGATTVYGVIATSTFTAGNTVVTVVNDAAAAIPTSLTAVDVAVADANSYQLSAAGKLADALIAQTAVTQHQAALALAASQTTSGTFDVARIPDLAASKITSGTFADARISESSVTQHAAALGGGLPVLLLNGVSKQTAGASINRDGALDWTLYDQHELAFMVATNSGSAGVTFNLRRSAVNQTATFNGGVTRYGDATTNIGATTLTLTQGNSNLAFVHVRMIITRILVTGSPFDVGTSDEMLLIEWWFSQNTSDRAGAGAVQIGMNPSDRYDGFRLAPSAAQLDCGGIWCWATKLKAP